MKQETKKSLLCAILLILGFWLWTIMVCQYDVQSIGPNGSSVGFATINRFVHKTTGVHMVLYVVTDWLGLVPIAVAFGFAILGLIQWIRRKSVFKVDSSILVLGGFYLIVIAAYLTFEYCVINYRPVLINGYLEASYPSSTTMLVICVMSTAIIQFNMRIINRTLKFCVCMLIASFICFMIIGRLLSGVHWISDIIGGILLSAGLVTAYRAIVCN